MSYTSTQPFPGVRRWLDDRKRTERIVTIGSKHPDGTVNTERRDDEVLALQMAAFTCGARTSPVEFLPDGTTRVVLHGRRHAVIRTMESLIRMAAREGATISTEP